MKLYFVRHGESTANLLNEISNRGLKLGLTEKGKRQASVLARKLKGLPIIRVFSSPLLRAVQTAEILAREWGLAFETADALREYDCGILEGKSDAASWQRHREVYEAWVWRREWEKRLEQGESFVDIRRRFVPFIEELIQRHQGQDGGIVLVGHGGTYRCMLPLIMDNIDLHFAMRHPIGHTVAIVAKVRPAGLFCLEWGETQPGQVRHL